MSVLLAKTDEFALFVRNDQPAAEWLNLKVVHGGEAPKIWWLSWNGKRLSRRKDTGKLAAYNPKVFQWVIDTLVALGGEWCEANDRGPIPPRANRKLETMVPPNLTRLACNGDFVLYECKAPASKGWRNLKLSRIASLRGQKNNWLLGWNGKRFAYDDDFVRLKEFHPAVCRWLLAGMASGFEVSVDVTTESGSSRRLPATVVTNEGDMVAALKTYAATGIDEPPRYRCDNAVRSLSGRLAKPLWCGLQWQVSACGIEKRDGTYSIAADRLWENEATFGWIAHMSEKGDVNLEDFCEALRIARSVLAGRLNPRSLRPSFANAG